MAFSRRLRLGMVGGGPGSFIGPVHRMAARIDDRYDFVAGALSSDPQRAAAGGVETRLAPERTYESWQAMLEGERAREDRVDLVAIVTPNHLHHAPARAFLAAGFHVMCDKPLTLTAAEAEDLAEVQKASGALFGVTHTYAGYPMVREARALVAAGALGRLRLVQVEYVQSWLTEALESTGNKQAGWRTDPKQSGAGGCLGDIGTHAYHLAGFVAGEAPSAIAADLAVFGQGRTLDDNCQILMRYADGARGMLWASQVAPGNDNGLRLRLYGEKGGLSWRQEQPNELEVTFFGEAPRILTRGGAALPGYPPRYATRIPAGHPEGFLEAFATLYTDMAEQIAARLEGRAPAAESLDLPTLADGLAGMRFIEAAVASNEAGTRWVSPVTGPCSASEAALRSC